MQFVAVNLLLLPFDPIGAFLITLLVNARHLFYGISMLDKYKNQGLKKIYLIYAMCDESFSLNSTIEFPETVDQGWFMFFVSLLNQFYWVAATALGAILGSLITIPAQGLEFVLTALFTVLFVDQWLKSKNHFPAFVGIVSAVACLLIFGTQFFMPATMVVVLICFFFSYHKKGTDK